MIRKNMQVKFIPGDGKDNTGELLIRIPVDSSFDPKTMFLTRHCCNLDLSTGCKVASPGQNCADPGKIEVWM
jgi:hypothetical protein